MFLESNAFEHYVDVPSGKTKALGMGSDHHDVAAEGRFQGGSMTSSSTGDITTGYLMPYGGADFAREGVFGNENDRIKPGEVTIGPPPRGCETLPKGAASSMVHMEGDGQVGVLYSLGL